MPLSPDEFTMGGLVLATLSMAIKGLLDLLKQRTTTQNKRNHTVLFDNVAKTLKELEEVRKEIGILTARRDRTEEFISMLNEIESQSEELLRMHRDPQAGFSTSETNRLLNEVLRSLSSLRGELHRRNNNE